MGEGTEVTPEVVVPGLAEEESCSRHYYICRMKLLLSASNEQNKPVHKARPSQQENCGRVPGRTGIEAELENGHTIEKSQLLEGKTQRVRPPGSLQSWN